MVATMIWLSEMGSRFGTGLKRSFASSDPKKNNNHPFGFRQDKSPVLGILAFETAKAMSRIVSLYKSLSDNEIFKLRKEVMRSPGVAYLNSTDEAFLLNLACAERIEELDRAAIVVARLGRKCFDPGLNGFEQIYSDLKLGLIDLTKLDFGSREIEKITDKMEKYISSTSALYSALEAVAELEVSERKLKQWKRHPGQLQAQKTNSDLFDQKLAWQRQQVRHYRDVSLWSQPFDKSVGLMARTICIIYARICTVFGPYISVLPQVPNRHSRSTSHQFDYPLYPIRDRSVKEISACSKSGPLPGSNNPKRGLIRFWSRESNPEEDMQIGMSVGFGIGFKENHYYLFGGVGKRNKLLQVAPPSTLGGSGLALRYANVIIQVEKYVDSPCSIGNDTREQLYQMLPASLKMSVKAKLKNTWSREKNSSKLFIDESLAEGWREALKEILGWLAPMAHDTVKWQTERNFEKQNFDAKPTILLLQTLHFSDREKTEAAISEVLVGLSCICRYENERSGKGSGNVPHK
ncbi:PREDICTED: uncharacterized protein LOC104597338 [Nelumbo nucifera]|uniref:Avr9/Cf-9 rapidly elicited protein 137 n=2 Tax=Nelumbo nucifera TaxID=4432 RepID=A0A822Y5P2_NELNU|nr:PREDICTED: uncharacterized protein LOC104597338 [Nelumbo nucifera]DAD26506.1 TPA_asm: hypothetical protein HUJ06_027974 [Nelumbo nucifera]